jgi:hypothetical protein
MAAKTPRPNGSGLGLQAAITLLIQTQAQSVKDIAESRREFAESRKEFAEIRKELETIKAVLVRHETMLEKLPEAIREKIGFKS